jgi:hypothetical protein
MVQYKWLPVHAWYGTIVSEERSKDIEVMASPVLRTEL